MSNELIETATNQVEIEERLFELAQRKAKVYAGSSLVPKEYQNNIGNVMIAENMSRRMGADTLMVMQNLYVVHGKPGWSAQFLIACFNSCGRFSAIKYRFTGERGTTNWGCVAFAKELSTNETVEGSEVTIAMATKEGWINKAGSKWQSMPEQMLRYRSATFLIRSTAPEIGMGLLTKDELDDMPHDEPIERQVTPEVLRAKLAPRNFADPGPATDELPETSYTPNTATKPAGMSDARFAEVQLPDSPPMTAVDQFRAEALECDTARAVATLTENWIGPGSARELTPEDVEQIQNEAAKRIGKLKNTKGNT